MATENLLADFLKEIRDISITNKHKECMQLADNFNNDVYIDREKGGSPYSVEGHPERMAYAAEGDNKGTMAGSFKEEYEDDTKYHTGGDFDFDLPCSLSEI